MAKKILTKKDFNALVKGTTKAVSVNYCDYSIGVERRGEYIQVVDLSKDFVIDVISVDNCENYDFVYGRFEKRFKEYQTGDKTEETSKQVEIAPLVEDKPKTLVETITDEIAKNIAITGVAQLNVALLIRTVYEKELYKELEYKNIYDYCSDRFSIARGTTSNWLMVATNFGEYDEESQRYILDKRLQGFTITQLILLRSLPIEDILLYFDESMSCRDIKDKVNGLNRHITSGAKEVKSPVANEPTKSIDKDDNYEVRKSYYSSNIKLELMGGEGYDDNEGWKVLISKLKNSSGQLFELRLTAKD